MYALSAEPSPAVSVRRAVGGRPSIRTSEPAALGSRARDRRRPRAATTAARPVGADRGRAVGALRYRRRRAAVASVAVAVAALAASGGGPLGPHVGTLAEAARAVLAAAFLCSWAAAGVALIRWDSRPASRPVAAVAAAGSGESCLSPGPVAAGER